MRDFTVNIYKKLLNEIMNAGYGLISFEEYLMNSEEKNRTIILRHDVDKRPLRALKTAELENDLGIKGTYYFRIKKNKIPGEVIKKITKLGHEIGYHYEDLDTAGGDVEAALVSFQNNLTRLRETVPVRTICMHGSPMSRHDNRELWESHSYREFGIIGEPYFDIDFTKVMYLTDTGRRWDGNEFSFRDKSMGDGVRARGKRNDAKMKTEDRKKIDKENGNAVCDLPLPNIHSTWDMINALKNNRLPDKIMLTLHPQRWNNNHFVWLYELIWQKIKNPIKHIIIRKTRKNKSE